MKVVWILGAGFSRPLGGPLLADLFADPMLRRLEAELKARNAEKIGELMRTVLHPLYAQWTGEDHGFKVRARDSWLDPEQFLDRLERAADEAEDSPARAHMLLNDERLSDRTLEEARWLARSYLALACHHFLPPAHCVVEDDERWRPYCRWAKELVTQQDTIVTFNYDLVVERLFGEGIGIPIPGKLDVEPYRPTLLKLHGSVDWSTTGADDGTLARGYNPWTFIAAREPHVTLGIPGPSKIAASKRFDALWRRAEEAIRNADAVVLVGYRFAQTDDEAKRRLLGALRSNIPNAVSVRTILGPQTGSDDVRRVEGLLGWTLRSRQLWQPSEIRRELRSMNLNAYAFFEKHPNQHAVVDTVPLYAQDFFAVASRWDLVEWPVQSGGPARSGRP